MISFFFGGCNSLNALLCLMTLLHKLVPAGQIGLQQHVGGVGRCSQQVGEQQRHLEGLATAPLQNLRALSPIDPTAVVQLVKLTVGGWEVHECVCVWGR